MVNYNVADTISSKEIKRLRGELGLTQKEFAEFMSCSKPTIERWERSKDGVSGPEAVLIRILLDYNEIIDYVKIPEKRYPTRMWYMYKDKKCTLIDVDEMNQKVEIKNYVRNPVFRAFGNNLTPTYDDYLEFLESRCFPRTRDKIKIELDRIGVPFYDPYLIVEKTEGRMGEDDFWIQIER